MSYFLKNLYFSIHTLYFSSNYFKRDHTTNFSSPFLISLQHDRVNLPFIILTSTIWPNIIHSLKYQRSKTSDYNYFRIRKIWFVPIAHLLCCCFHSQQLYLQNKIILQPVSGVKKNINCWGSSNIILNSHNLFLTCISSVSQSTKSA